jgi:MSHA biogenesis protein MshJ
VKALLKRYAERIDAATLRERVMIFAAAALLLVFLVNAALIEPLRSKQKRLAAENAQRQEELRTVQAELQRMAQTRDADPDAAGRQRASALRGELANLNAQIAEEQRRFTAPDRVRSLLDEMLERNKRLRLVDLKTLPASSITEGSLVFRHGLEMTISGSYLDLYEYLSALERLPNQLYWGRAELSAGEYPEATLKLTVYTVSFDKAWLIV